MSEPTVDPRAVTPVYGWHVPVLGDVPNIPADITALATGIEATLQAAVKAVHLNATIPTPTQTFPTGAVTKVTGWTTTANTTAGDFTVASGTVTCNKRGTYIVRAQLTFASGVPASNIRRLYIQENGASGAGLGYLPGTTSDVIAAIGVVQLAAGGTVQTAVFQNDTASVALYTTGHSLLIAKIADF